MLVVHRLARARRRWLLPAAALAALVLPSAVYVSPAAADPPADSCQEIHVPVSLDLLLTAHAHVQLCVPGGARHSAIRVASASSDLLL